MLEPRTYNDEINDVVVHFHSDAPQNIINGLQCAGEWYDVKGILLSNGWTVVEQNLN
jgi:hypothetical protein